MRVTRYFSPILICLLVLSSCGTRDMSEPTVDAAPDMNELAAWGDEDVSDIDQPSIWEITKRHNSFSTFSLLMEVAGLEETLKYDKRITVLAPTEEAFRQLGEGSIVELLKEDNRAILEELLLNHIIPEVYRADDLQDGETRATLGGRYLTINRDEQLRLSNATVTTADIDARNGVVHVVDQVILVK